MHRKIISYLESEYSSSSSKQIVLVSLSVFIGCACASGLHRKRSRRRHDTGSGIRLGHGPRKIWLREDVICKQPIYIRNNNEWMASFELTSRFGLRLVLLKCYITYIETLYQLKWSHNTFYLTQYEFINRLQ